jgi:hypothetical protein
MITFFVYVTPCRLTEPCALFTEKYASIFRFFYPKIEAIIFSETFLNLYKTARCHSLGE